MSVRHEVLCIKKSDRPNPHERVTHIGGRNADGTTWRLTQEEAIRGIEEGRYAFFVRRGVHEVNVVIASSPYGHKYLRTEADGQHPNNLLALPECR